MKKQSFCMLSALLLVCALMAKSSHPGGPVLSKDKITGTWRTVENGILGTSTEYYFTIYADQRIFMIAPTFPQPCNGLWVIQDDLFIPSYDDYYLMGTFQTLAINEREWTFIDLNTNTRRVAIKLSAVPVPVPQENKVPQPQNPAFPVRQLFGTWKAQTNKGEHFYFTIYEDQRFFNCYGMTGNWTVLGDKFYNYLDHRNSPSITQTISFSTQRWVYVGLGTGTQYTATKVASTPQRQLTSKCKQPDPKPAQCSICKQTLDRCPGHLFCSCCAGNGTQQCNSCYGNGTRSIRGADGREYRVNCGNCSSGRVTCGCCNGTGNQ